MERGWMNQQPSGKTQWEAAIAFFLDHGQCLDWIFFGDPGGMITGAVARSARAEEIA